MESKIKHLDFIQSVINRMANNSFLLKGWSVTLVIALFALASTNSRESYILLAYFPCLIFWGLDAYFLQQERMYRILYEKVRSVPPASVDFDLDASKFIDEVDSWFFTAASKTLSLFHGTTLGVIILIMLIINNCGV